MRRPIREPDNFSDEGVGGQSGPGGFLWLVPWTPSRTAREGLVLGGMRMTLGKRMEWSAGEGQGTDAGQGGGGTRQESKALRLPGQSAAWGVQGSAGRGHSMFHCESSTS